MKLKTLLSGFVFAVLLVSKAAAAESTDNALSLAVDPASIQYTDRLLHQPVDPLAGNPAGSISIVEFFDYQCPHCIDMTDVLDKVVAKNHSLRVVFKELPFRGPVSEFAARAALAAKKQGKYTELHEALMHPKEQPLTNEIVLAIAKSVGLDIDRLKNDITSADVTQQINDNLKLAQDLRVRGTPAFFLSKTNKPDRILFVLGWVDLAQFESLIKKAS